MSAKPAIRTNYPMTRRERERWNARSPSVVALTRCDFCGNLHADPEVASRTTMFPHRIKMFSCGRCFSKHVQQAIDDAGVVYC